MEKNIYDLLNEVEIDLDEYEAEEFTKLEEKRILNKFFKKTTKKVNDYKKYMVAASVAIVSFGAVGSLPTLATMNPTLYKIANLLGLEKDLADYSTVLNQPVTKEGITIGLGEVVYDKQNHKLVVTTYMRTPEIIEVPEGEVLYSPHERVFINGKQLNTASRIETVQIDEYTVANVIRYDMKEEFVGALDIKIWIPQVFIAGKEYRNHWSFEFTVDGEKLAKDTMVIGLGEHIELSNGESLTLAKYTDNPFGQSIYYQTSNLLHSHMLEIRGEDNLGNKVVFQPVGATSGEGGEFKLSREFSNLSPEATSLTVTVYACELPEEDGPITADYEPVSDEIKIPLK
ncbi:MAG: DUF4179 domain-containing protein [Cellulosilyticaceae bacterium]